MKVSTSVRLKTILAERGLKQSDVLRMSEPLQKSLDIGMSKSTFSQYVNGIQVPDQQRTYLLSKFFNVNEAWLMGYDVPRNILPEDLKEQPKSSYNYYEAGLSAGILATVDPFTEKNTQQITLSDVVMGKYSGDREIFITYINGESMNRIIPNGSLIAVKKVHSVLDLKDGDIVVFQDGSEMSVKRFYKNSTSQIVSFSPDSTDSAFSPMMYRYEDMDSVKVIGKVVVSTVIF